MADTTIKTAQGMLGRLVSDRPLALRWSRDGKLQYARHWTDLDTMRQGREWIDVPTEEAAAPATSADGGEAKDGGQKHG